MSTRTELVAAIRERYERSNSADRSVILSEFVAITGYHRKHAIRLLASAGDRPITPARRAPRRYDADVRAALIVLWEASDRSARSASSRSLRSCFRRSSDMVGSRSPPRFATLLLAISPASMDRLLERGAAHRSRRPSAPRGFQLGRAADGPRPHVW